MNEKKKCPNCGLLIDSDMKSCPYCGFILDEKEDDKEENQIDKNRVDEKKIVQRLTNEETKKPKVKFLSSKNEENISYIKRLLLFFFMIIGLSLISSLVVVISNKVNPYFLKTLTGQAIINFSLYFVAFGACLLILNSDCIKVFKKYTKGKTYLNGISYGVLLIILSSTYNVIIHFFFPDLNSNNNENTINQIVGAFPILSIIIFGVIGPMCEEFAYRLGLFGFLKKYNRTFAYIISALIFGFIHFDFEGDMFTELLNIPSYIMSGLFLCYVYDIKGLETSTIAHATNNLVSIILTIFYTL